MEKKQTPAQAIKKKLKTLFPSVSFSVRYKTFSMGNSVDIYWEDGPTTDQVDKIVGKHKYGHFDGMTDMYECTNLRDDIPQAKYVMCSRSMSPKTEEILYNRADSHYQEKQFECVWNKEQLANKLFQYYPINSENIEITNGGILQHYSPAGLYAIKS